MNININIYVYIIYIYIYMYIHIYIIYSIYTLYIHQDSGRAGADDRQDCCASMSAAHGRSAERERERERERCIYI